VVVGRIATLVIGVITISIGVTLIATAKRGLFEVMVTVFGIFIGPMLIPMLLGLLSKRVTWRGAAAGILAGLVSGLSFYFYKTLVLAKQAGIDPNWLRYDYEAISILTNFSVTLLAILLVTLVEKVSITERAKIDEFFVRLSTPINVSQTHARVTGEVFSPFFIIGWVTGGTGFLLLIASVVQPAGIGRYINLAAGLTICILGYGFYRLHGRVMQKQARLVREDAAAVAAETQ
jgi:hypothetical protein